MTIELGLAEKYEEMLDEIIEADAMAETRMQARLESQAMQMIVEAYSELEQAKSAQELPDIIE